MAKVKISAAHYAEAHKQFQAVVGKGLRAQGDTKRANRLRGDGIFSKWFSKRKYEEFLAQGGKAGDWKAFAEWLLENLPKIIAMIKLLFPVPV